MNPDLQDTLEECLARIRGGESIASCLERYPHHAEDLRAILTLAQGIRALPIPRASAAAIRSGRLSMLAVVKQVGEQPVSESFFSRYARKIFTRLTGKENPDMRFVTRFAMALLIAVFGVLAASGTLAASANTIPGDLLYPLKTAIQDVRLNFVVEPTLHDQIAVDIQATRQADIRSVLDLRRVAEVHFWGRLTAIGDRSWIIGDHIIFVFPETEIVGEPYLGATVSVFGTTRDDGTIVAKKVIIDPDRAGPPFDLIHFSGELTHFDDRTWTVGGHTLLIRPETYISGRPFLGAVVDVTARRSDADALVALALIVRPSDHQELIQFSGVLTAMDDRSWTIGDRRIFIQPETEIVGKPYIGAIIQVTARVTDDNRLIAIKLVVERPDGDLIRFYGLLEAFSRTRWVVAGHVVFIVPETQIVGEPFIRAIVKVVAWQRDDGLVSVELVVWHDDLPDHDLIKFSGQLTEFSRERWIVGDHIVQIVPRTEIDGEPFIGAQVHVTALRTDDGRLVGVLLVVEPRDIPSDELVHFTGELTAIRDSSWTVAGHIIKIVAETQIIGTPHLGARVEVFASLGTNGALVAHKLVVLPDNLPPADTPPTDETEPPPGDETDSPPTDATDTPPGDESDSPPMDATEPPPGDETDSPPPDGTDRPPTDEPEPPSDRGG